MLTPNATSLLADKFPPSRRGFAIGVYYMGVPIGVATSLLVVAYLDEQGAEISIWNQENEIGHTPLLIAEGIHRGMNIVSSSVTEMAIKNILDRYPLPQ